MLLCIAFMCIACCNALPAFKRASFDPNAIYQQQSQAAQSFLTGSSNNVASPGGSNPASPSGGSSGSSQSGANSGSISGSFDPNALFQQQMQQAQQFMQSGGSKSPSSSSSSSSSGSSSGSSAGGSSNSFNPNQMMSGTTKHEQWRWEQ
ncbi:hypothetical protein KP79_PYT10579 [Mizuhopecten yessoensis]|uniref:Uncharacterized protein n=1 Tax=Mizuhopecten yessoensis TaxID=6573 RepID=A0A210PGX9_MIZYE|nr:hypothetical protein KP79_PYT10579 [Mizuhopecten yessoensis]